MTRPARRLAGNGSGSPGPVSGRPGLIPANPLPLSKALIQVAVLLGIPLALLLVGKTLIRHYFPGLGY